MHNQIELSHLRHFYEVARQGNFTRASKKLQVSQPSVSKTVSLLENRLDSRLLDRGRKGITLTPTGRRLFDSCQTIFQELEQAARDLATQRQECTGDLLVGASDNLCNYLLPPLLGHFMTKHPKVTPRLYAGTSDDIKRQLLDGALDLGLFYTPTKEPALETERLGHVEFWLVTAARNARTPLKDLVCVGSRAVDYHRPYPALRMLEQLGIRPARFFETNSQETQKRMVLAGYGYTLIPEHMVRDELKKGALHRIKTQRKVGYDVLACKRKGRTLSRPASLFLELVKKQITS